MGHSERGAGLVKLMKGARFPTHNHPGWEEALIVSGVVKIGGNRLVEGDYLFTEAGETHDAIPEEDTVFDVSSEKGIWAHCISRKWSVKISHRT